MTLTTLAVVAVAWLGHLAVALSAVHGDDLGYIDLLVYRAGGSAILHGNSIYAGDFAGVNDSPNGLPFTYPPFSGLLFVPFALVPVSAAKVLMALANAVAGLVFFAVFVLAISGRWQRLRSWGALTAPISVRTGSVLAAAAVLFWFSVPVRENFNHGQVNMILAAVVAVDLLLPTVRWPRGLLVGIAVAVKLTPAVFIGYFFVTRQWRAMVTSLLTAAAAVLVAWLVIPADTVRYFSTTLFDTERIGGLAFASNQSIRGVLERFPAVDAHSGVLWLVAVALVLALAIAAILASRRRGDVPAAVLSAAFIGLLCSPVSWGHHWVWLSAAMVYLLMRWAATGGAGTAVAAVAVTAVTVAAPWTYLPSADDRERLWSPLQHAVGNAWALVALGLLLWFALADRRTRTDREDVGCA
ncbi:glycosyltransferase 87 family protein [Mycobacterium sp. MYCO198283]|uniref:glycosyltransferase 87 family protein n=1 Tax=Mycobacterium sp. MYCO198283 TaxID=2883505 RepID=UPI001E2ADBEF|nr:glycosyltransferase 87 family protein [Mycobacterium sp. MYCO198283]MCG5432295.1 glycosyltransferase 87 family protein [Mycobacterium sp. MYCO198283]